MGAIPFQPGWGVVLGSALLGLLDGFMGMRVWRGKTIVPWNSRESEDRLAVLSVTMLPTSVMFLSASLAALGLRALAAVHNAGLTVLLSGL